MTGCVTHIMMGAMTDVGRYQNLLKPFFDAHSGGYVRKKLWDK